MLICQTFLFKKKTFWTLIRVALITLTIDYVTQHKPGGMINLKSYIFVDLAFGKGALLFYLLTKTNAIQVGDL